MEITWWHKLPLEIQDNILFYLGSHFRIYLGKELIPWEIFLDGGYYSIILSAFKTFGGMKEDILENIRNIGSIDNRYLEYAILEYKKILQEEEREEEKEKNISVVSKYMGYIKNYLPLSIRENPLDEETILYYFKYYMETEVGVKRHWIQYYCSEWGVTKEDFSRYICTIPFFIHSTIIIYKDTNPEFLSKFISVYNTLVGEEQNTTTFLESMRRCNLGYGKYNITDMDIGTIHLFIEDITTHGTAYTKSILKELCRFNRVGLLAKRTLEVMEAIENKDEKNLYRLFPTLVHNRQVFDVEDLFKTPKYLYEADIYFHLMEKYKFIPKIGNGFSITDTINYYEDELDYTFVYEPRICVTRVLQNIHCHDENIAKYEASLYHIRELGYGPYDKICYGIYIMNKTAYREPDYLENYGEEPVLPTWEYILEREQEYLHLDALYEYFKLDSSINFRNIGFYIGSRDIISIDSIVWLLRCITKEKIPIKGEFTSSQPILRNLNLEIWEYILQDEVLFNLDTHLKNSPENYYEIKARELDMQGLIESWLSLSEVESLRLEDGV